MSDSWLWLVCKHSLFLLSKYLNAFVPGRSLASCKGHPKIFLSRAGHDVFSPPTDLTWEHADQYPACFDVMHFGPKVCLWSRTSPNTTLSAKGCQHSALWTRTYGDASARRTQTLTNYLRDDDVGGCAVKFALMHQKSNHVCVLWRKVSY